MALIAMTLSDQKVSFAALNNSQTSANIARMNYDVFTCGLAAHTACNFNCFIEAEELGNVHLACITGRCSDVDIT